MTNITPYLQNKHSHLSSRKADKAEDTSYFSQKIETLEKSLSDNESSCEEHSATFLPNTMNLNFIEELCTKDKDDLNSCVTSINGHINNTELPVIKSGQYIGCNTVSVHSIDELSLIFENQLLNGKHSDSLPSIWSISYQDNSGVNIDFVVSKRNAKQFSVSCAIPIDNIASYLQELNQRLTKKGWVIQSDNETNNFVVQKIVNKK
ncbi:MAG: hypothetical protein N0E59_04740 [Candidatus Thiodiazotropha taylori]|nr:hypothetical protein [Candidatus Thiodiazotropha taylori]MCG8108021.1 hypothetical protein [Candidatus Thiodiazotropha taylori]MCG8110048.1 hypothetical protein [Candidatus Thiodiazotropha taylori]MCW4280359.1 hypothetical protein [Candidatus Thiodiazotropha taylori]MCW4282394.1 hypothetical protein [Candidatus Thiodiazotropha taylori]